MISESMLIQGKIFTQRRKGGRKDAKVYLAGLASSLAPLRETNYPTVASINISNLRRAAPLSTAPAASFAPSRRSAAAPPRNSAAAAFITTSARASSVREGAKLAADAI